MKKILKKNYYKYKIVFLIFYFPKKIIDIIDYYKIKKLTDEEFIQYRYKNIFNREADLLNPTLFTEKIQWLKLNDRNELYTQCADKYFVRSYVEKKVGSNCLIPLRFVTQNYLDINIKNISDYPCIIKTTHDSGGTFIINEKNRFKLYIVRQKLKKRLKQNYYLKNREWEYKNIIPRIIVEELIKDKNNTEQLNDYKIHCFNGIPKFIQTIFDRGDETKEDWYDTDWNLLDLHYFSPVNKYVEKPKLLKKLLEVASKLSKDFIYVRVDLYIANNQVYFGELTLRPYGGFIKFVPESFDEELGEYLVLNKDTLDNE